MEFSGERFIPGAHDNIEVEHLHRYLQACELASGKQVLDLASGEGYGSAMLAKYAATVTGVDISREAVEHARERYTDERLDFLVGSCDDIPLPNDSVDLVVSFETIDRHDQHDAMMREVKRVLRPDGMLLISSPDKYNHSVEPGYDNPYHVKELYDHEFRQLLGAHFKNIRYFGQRVVYGSAIVEESAPSSLRSYWRQNDTIKEGDGIARPTYRIALASDAALPQLTSGLFELPVDRSEIVQTYAQRLAEREAEREATIEELRRLTDLAGELKERDRRLAELRRTVRDREERIARLKQSVLRREAQIAELEEDLATRAANIADLYQSVAEREKQLDQFDQALADRDKQILTLANAVHEILRSTSWQLTGPGRALGVYARRAVSGLLDLPTTIRARVSRLRSFRTDDGKES